MWRGRLQSPTLLNVLRVSTPFFTSMAITNALNRQGLYGCVVNEIVLLTMMQMVPLVMMELLSFLPGIPGIFLACIVSAALRWGRRYSGIDSPSRSSAPLSLKIHFPIVSAHCPLDRLAIVASLLKDMIEPAYVRIRGRALSDRVAILLAKSLSEWTVFAKVFGWHQHCDFTWGVHFKTWTVGNVIPFKEFVLPTRPVGNCQLFNVC